MFVYNELLKQKKENLFESIMSVSAISAFPVIFMYCQNADEAGFGEIVPVLLGYLAVGILLFTAFAVVLRTVAKATLISIVFIIILLNFTLLENLLKIVFPSLRYWHSVPILLVIGMHFAYFISRLIKEEIAEVGVKILGLVFGCLIAINVIFAIPQIVNHLYTQNYLKKSNVPDVEVNADVGANRPNIYLLIFDEYANFPQLKEYYNYDNLPLLDFLENNHFNISYSSHNESTASNTIQTNMVNLDYIVDDSTSASEKKTLSNNAFIFDLMRENGYEVRIYSRNGVYNGVLPNGTRSSMGATTINGESMQTLLLQRTILYPFLSNQVIIQRMKDYEVMAQYLSAPVDKQNGLFTLAYFCIPHQPFIVDENGRDIEISIDWENPQYYLGQLKYTTKLIISILNGIIKNNSDSIIILMSDHGARGSATVSFPWDVKTNSLNAVYYQGKELDIEGLSNVNTLRTIINELFNMDYEMVDVPNS